MADRMRIDKFLWAVRIFKTRSIATQACKNNKVLLDDQPLKAAKEVGPDDEIQVRKEAIWYRYRIKAVPKSRVGAKLVPDLIEDITPEDQIVKLQVIRQSNNLGRERGTGRPTKKERRDLEGFRDEE